MLVTTAVPRLPPLTIRRPRLERWLRAYAQTPLRLLVAPSGFGKTSVLLTYASERQQEVAYCALPPGCDVTMLRLQISRAANGAPVPATYDQLLDLVNGSPAHCRELVIDDADNANDEAAAELISLVDDVAENVTLIYAARSRKRIQARKFIARGVAAACHARMLAFDAEETATFAEACGAESTDLDVRRLIEETDGWPIPLCGAIRVAAAEGLRLMDGYERWRAQSAVFLHELVNAELERVDEAARSAFWSLMNGSAKVERDRLYDLESQGLFIYDNGGGQMRLNRALRFYGARAQAESASDRFTPPMMVHMFRSFSAAIDGRQIPWVRRRDQQIIKYLLLKPDGRATRAEVESVFWNGTDRHLATQSVRTACSTIRKAIASVVGHTSVERYFRTAPDLQIDLHNVVCDVRRFIAHVNDADAAYGAGDVPEAAMHYRAADKLYAGGLLEFEAAEAWFNANACILHERFVMLLERLAEIALQEGALDDARRYAARAQMAAPESTAVPSLLARIESARRAEIPAAAAAPGAQRLQHAYADEA